MIYFIQEASTHHIKIGVSANPLKRLKDLQTAHPAKLRLLAVMDGAQREERALHKKFENANGEWFKPTSELFAFIKEYAMSPDALALPVTKAVPAQNPPPAMRALSWDNLQSCSYFALWLYSSGLAVWSTTFLIAPYVNPHISQQEVVWVLGVSIHILLFTSIHITARRRASKK